MEKKFDFSLEEKKGFIHLNSSSQISTPLYSKQKGYGFMEKTTGICPKDVCLNRITHHSNGYVIQEDKSTISWNNCNDFNYGGLVFRIDVEELGGYKIEVTTTSSKESTNVSVSGMQADWIMSQNPWDAAGLVEKRNFGKWSGHTWSFEYVTGVNYLEIEVEPFLEREVEPSNGSWEVGISQIVITKIDNRKADETIKPTIFTLGDSTVKTYVFEEAGMSGWGQVFDDLFDLSQVEVINYSQGGRSFKSMYTEGRFNEVLLRGKIGDYILVQSGHNDESTGPEAGPIARFGRGATAKTYESWIRQVYIPSIKSRGMIPILVTPMTRINCSNTTQDHIEWYGFKNSDCPGIDFPKIMKDTAKDLDITLLDLYEESIQYLTEIGGDAANAMFLSIEAGEYPSKTNSGSYANGNPSGSSDGTHYKETLSKQWARIIVTEIEKKNLPIASYLNNCVKTATDTGNWEEVYPEIAKDVQTGQGAYYRNQIEKMIQLGVVTKDIKGMFYPKQNMETLEFIQALNQLWSIEINNNKGYDEGILTREIMGAIFYDAYLVKFKKDSEGRYNKSKYLTDYNGTNLAPDDPNYDPNLTGESAQYYPLTTWDKVKDVKDISEVYKDKVKEAYQLGLIRCEKGIQRGVMANGEELEPRQAVTREKAAKALYFMWVLSKDIRAENDKLL